MEIYILTSMIMNILGIGVLIQKISSCDYNVPKEQSKGGDFVTLSITLGFVIWAGTLVL